MKGLIELKGRLLEWNEMRKRERGSWRSAVARATLACSCDVVILSRILTQYSNTVVNRSIYYIHIY